jgi:hypothetical protein
MMRKRTTERKEEKPSSYYLAFLAKSIAMK